jgi:hypothetical protein
MLQCGNHRRLTRPRLRLGSSRRVGTLTISPREIALSYTPAGGVALTLRVAAAARAALSRRRSLPVCSPAQREMGPALLPTPLSPAVGSRRNAYRLACPASARRLSAVCRPALAPVPVPSWARYDPKIHPLPSAVPRPIVVPGFSSGLAYPKIDKSSKPGRFVRPFRLRALAVSTLRDLTDPKIFRFPLLHPAASRGRVESGSKISSFFRVLPRPSEEPIPALDALKMR